MKTYPFIIIDKNNMSVLRHFPTAEQCADAMYGKTEAQILTYIVVKDEKVVVDFSELLHFDELPKSIYRRVLEILSRS